MRGVWHNCVLCKAKYNQMRERYHVANVLEDDFLIFHVMYVYVVTRGFRSTNQRVTCGDYQSSQMSRGRKRRYLADTHSSHPLSIFRNQDENLGMLKRPPQQVLDRTPRNSPLHLSPHALP
jgi:hypothetical protein